MEEKLKLLTENLPDVKTTEGKVNFETINIRIFPRVPLVNDTLKR